VRTASGATVPLKAVADIGFGQGPSKIRRYNQARRLSLEADLNHTELGPAMKKIRDLPIYKNLPPGVQIVDVGQAQYMQELLTGFVLAIVAGIMLVFAVLVLLFARLFQPITILSALPLSIGGTVIALGLTGSPASIGTWLGILMLSLIISLPAAASYATREPVVMRANPKPRQWAVASCLERQVLPARPQQPWCSR